MLLNLDFKKCIIGGKPTNLIKRNDFIFFPKDEQSRALQLIPVLSFTDDAFTADRIVIDCNFNRVRFADSLTHRRQTLRL